MAKDTKKTSRRSSPRDGTVTYEQLKLKVHKGLLPLLKSQLITGGNRSAWIEEAIVEKLRRLNDPMIDDLLDRFREASLGPSNDNLVANPRFSTRKGNRTYVQVKLVLHRDLIPKLTNDVTGGNRNAWIEEAVREKLKNLRALTP